MIRDDFRDYMNSAKLLRFQTVQYSKVHQLGFGRNGIYNITSNLIFCMVIKNSEQQMCFPVYQL